MKIKDVENLAELAKLDLKEEEKQIILKDLDSILGYIKQVEDVEVEDYQDLNVYNNKFREDEVLNKYEDKDLIINQFPDKYENFVKVKKIL